MNNAEPVQLELDCPKCDRQHIDEGEWATRPHKTHQCQSCGHEWKPFDYETVGVSLSNRDKAKRYFDSRYTYHLSYSGRYLLSKEKKG